VNFSDDFEFQFADASVYEEISWDLPGFSRQSAGFLVGYGGSVKPSRTRASRECGPALPTRKVRGQL
jgi:hypothetical protein